VINVIKLNWKKLLNGKYALMISFIVTGIFIGMLVISQFQSYVVANTFVVDELKTQKELLNSFDADRKQLNSQISSLRQKIAITRKNSITNNSNLLDTLDKLKQQVGLTQIIGKGVAIKLNDGSGASNGRTQSFIYSADLRDMVNLLRTAQVNAISINGQRVLASTPINSVGGIILVNKVQVAPPFIIDVVGNLELITSRLNDRNEYPDLFDRIKNKKVDFIIQTNNRLIIPAYDGDFSLKYSQTK